MSSFRIDRQYVAFQTAETEPVFATNQVQQSPETYDETGGYDGDLSKLYNEIYERLLDEHAEQAELMLSKASEESREIIEKAKKQAEEIISRAKEDASKFRKEIKEQIESEENKRKSLEQKELLRLETELRSSYDTLVGGLQDGVISLVMEIVRKVIGLRLSQSDEVFIALIRDALERLKQTGSVIIRVGPEDYARYFGHERAPNLDTGETKVTVVEEPDFSPGDLIVESEGEIVDLSIDRQIRQIEDAFTN